MSCISELKLQLSRQSEMTKKITIGLICGGTSGEHEVSLISAYNIQAALSREKFNVLLVGIDKNGSWYLGNHESFLKNVENVRKVSFDTKFPVRFPQRNLKKQGESSDILSEVDVFFPITHGKHGEDGALQGLLEIFGKPYVGADVYGSAICMDKDVTKRLLREYGIPIAKYKMLRKPEELRYEDAVQNLGETLFVKPCREGSSLGVSKVRSSKEYFEALREAFAADSKVLVEESVSGREIECSVLGNNSPEAASVLGEIEPAYEFYSYEAKYVDERGADLIVPADIDLDVSRNIRQTAVDAFQVTECRGMARIDFFLKSDNTFILNEINTLPGFTNISMYPKLWEASGLTYPDLLESLIGLALE